MTTSAKKCDHTSVGILAWHDSKLLLIERANLPYGFALPAGHVDGDIDYEAAAKREFKEETGLEVVKLELVLEKRKENHCRRSGGTWHHWKLFKAEWKGELKRSEEETKQAAWFDTAALHELADHTKKYLAEETSEPEWQENPGLEPVMYEFLKELKII